MQTPRVLPNNTLYAMPEPDMELRVVGGSQGGGRIKLSVARSTSQTAETILQNQIDAEKQARLSGDNTEAQARSNGDAAEAQFRSSADTALSQALAAEVQARKDADTAEASTRASADTTEANARAAADAALQTQITALAGKIVPLSGSLVLPGGISLLVGKSVRTVNVTGLKVGDNLVVTPNAALPANISMGEAYCLTAGVLSVVVLNTALLALSIATTQTIPLGIIAIRP